MPDLGLLVQSEGGHSDLAGFVNRFWV